MPHPVQPLSTLRTPRRRDARKTRSRPACSALNGPDFHWQAHSSFPLAPRIRLLPRVSDGEPHAWPRMKDLRLGEELVGQFRHPRPCQSRSLTASAQPTMPEDDDMISECGQRQAVGRHGVVGEVTGDDLSKPFPRFGDRPVRALSQRLLDLPELRAHAVAPGFPFDEERASMRLAADEGASRPTGFRRQPLLEPCLNLSAHTAPIRRTCRSCRYASEQTGSSSPGPAFVENGWRVFCEP